MAHDIFISYSSRDHVIADAACAHLEGRGMRCWYAPRDIESGKSWAGSINDAIRESQIFALIFTDDSNASPQVLREINLAVSSGIPIVPVQLTRSEPAEDRRYYLTDIHWLDALDGPLEDALEKLGDYCESLLLKRSSEEAEREKARKLRRKRLVAFGCAGLALAVLCAVFLLLRARANRIAEGYIAPEEEETIVFSSLKSAGPGDWVAFGRYEQDGVEENGAEAVTWRVIERRSDSLVLMSRYGLDALPYSAGGTGSAWDESDVRAWLNGTFWEAAFTDGEKRRILVQALEPEANPNYGTYVGSAAEDRVRLPLVREAAALGKADRICVGTSRAQENGAEHHWKNRCDWWLATPGCSPRRASCMAYGGTLDTYGKLQESEGFVLRPVIEVRAPHMDLPEAKDEPAPEAAPEPGLPVIALGRYEQDGDILNGPEPLEWYVLSEEGGVRTLLARRILDVHEFNASTEKLKDEISWSNGSIRTWLNSEFLYAAFTEAERAAILVTDVAPDENPRYGRSAGTAVRDRVYLPGMSDLTEDGLLSASPTAFALRQGSMAGTWWLRTAGGEAGRLMCVRPDGTADTLGEVHSENSYLTYLGVRPMVRCADGVPEEPAAEEAPTVDVSGDTVIFGRWEQDGDPADGREPIEWLVLAEEDGRALLISRYSLDSCTFDRDAGHSRTTWEVCSLRGWLNGVFRTAAFTEAEQALICLTEVRETEHGDAYDAGNDTRDYIFPLDAEELLRLLPERERRAAKATAYAVSISNTAREHYWMRAGGIMNYEGDPGDFSGVGWKCFVRPALWIDTTGGFR